MQVRRPCGHLTGAWDTFEVTMKTQGEIEAAICERMARFEQEYMNRGPKDIHAHLIHDLLVLCLQGVLIAAERQLVKKDAAGRERSGPAQRSLDASDRDRAAGR
jgi:hypothetical protein